MMQYLDVNAIPYGLVLGLKHQMSVCFWKVHSIRDIEFAHWLNRRFIRIEWVHQLEIGRRLPVTLAQYHQTIARYFPKDPRDTVSSMEEMFGSTQTNSDLARAKLRKAKAAAKASETSDPSP
jgi:hypothetical protein